MSYKKPKVKRIYKLSEETKAIHRRMAALEGWKTRRVKQSLDRITKELKAHFGISPYDTRKIIANALQKPPVRNGWNDKTKPHKNSTINKRNLEKNAFSRDFLAKEAKAAKPKGAGYYIKKAFEEEKRKASPFALEKLNAININTAAGKREYALLFSLDALKVPEEFYEDLQNASKARKDLTPEERENIDWTQDVYKRALERKGGAPLKEDGSEDWREYYRSLLKEAGEVE